MPSSGITGSCGNSIFNFEELPNSIPFYSFTFLKNIFTFYIAIPFYIFTPPLAVYRGFGLSTSLPALVVTVFFMTASQVGVK